VITILATAVAGLRRMGACQSDTSRMGRGRLLPAVVIVILAVGSWLVLGRNSPTADPAAPIPSGAVPGTVLLIPGHGGDGTSLAPMARALAAAGWRPQVVDIGQGTGDITAYAAQLVDLAARTAATTGPVALVGYSEGGLIARAAIAGGAAPYVTRVVTVGTPHAGTSIAGLGVFVKSAQCDTACRQMAPGSDFLDDLPVAGDASRWLTVYSENDDVVRPADSAALPGATALRLQDACPGRTADHGQLIADPFILRAVPAFLAWGAVSFRCD
jgi:hypothetical protein